MAQKGFLHIDFDPELRKVRQDLARFEASLANKREVMLASMAVAQHEVRDNFDGEHDSGGDSWQPWKATPPAKGGDSYKKRAERFPNIGILQRTGDLARRAADSSAFRLVGDRLTYGHNLPRWAGVHLHGYNFGSYTLPQRSWYPFSVSGVAKVVSIFDEWMLGNLAVVSRKSSTGKSYVQVQTRTSSGRFGASPF